MQAHPTLTAETVEELRRAVIAQMGKVAARLAALKAGENVTLATLKLPWEREAETPLERTQRQYDHLKRVLASVAAGGYGRCERCGAPLPEAELRALPWADTCRACAERG